MGRFEIDQSYIASSNDKTYIQSEQRLIWAVIERAVLDILSEALSTSKANKREAEGWLTSVSLGVFSFRWCCEVLDLSASRIRQGVFWLQSELNKTKGKQKRRFSVKRMKNFDGLPMDILTTLLKERRFIINE